MGEIMYDIEVRDEDGAVLVNDSSEAIAMVYSCGHGVYARSLMDVDEMTALEIILGMDKLKDGFLKQSKWLRKMYKRRRRILRSVEEIDLTALHALMSMRGMEDDDAG
jgi:hypothetical protein